MTKTDWIGGPENWLWDGYAIKGHLLDKWPLLDWANSYVDMGPSPAGNLGPYWHVPLPSEDTVHRLYPKVLKTKWLEIIRQAVLQCGTGSQ